MALASTRSINDWDSLLISAFSPTPSNASLTAGIHSRQLSAVDSVHSLSATDPLISSISETPNTDRDFSPIPAEQAEAEPLDSPLSVSPLETPDSPRENKRVHVFVLEDGSPREWLSTCSYDVVSCSAGIGFTLLLTSRGTVLSFASSSSVSAGSGVSGVPAGLRVIPRLVGGLEVERALRHKRFAQGLTLHAHQAMPPSC